MPPIPPDLLTDNHYKDLEKKALEHLKDELPPDLTIIKGHLLSEYYLNQIVAIVKPESAHKIYRLSYFEKCGIAKTHIQDSTFHKLLALNRLRNRVGHELEYRLSESDVDRIGYLYGKKYIIDKYDSHTPDRLLRDCVMKIMVDIASDHKTIIQRHKPKN